MPLCVCSVKVDVLGSECGRVPSRVLESRVTMTMANVEHVVCVMPVAAEVMKRKRGASCTAPEPPQRERATVIL